MHRYENRLQCGGDFPVWRHYWWAAKRQWSARHGQRSELPAGCPEFTLGYSRRLAAVMWLVHRHYTPWFRMEWERIRSDHAENLTALLESK